MTQPASAPAASPPATPEAPADPAHAFPVMTTARLVHQCVLVILVAMPFFMIRNMLAVYCTDVLHLPEGQRAVIVGMLPFANMLFFMPMGLFSDWFAPRRLIQFGVLGYGCAITGMALIRQYEIPQEWLFPAMTALVGCFSAGWATLNSASASLFYKMIPKTDPARDRKIGIFAVCGALGFAGPLLIQLIPHGSGDPLATMPTLAAVIAGGALLASLLLPGTPPLARDPVARYIADARNPRVAWYLGLNFAWSVHFGAELNCIAPYMKKALGATDADLGVFFGLAAIPLAVMPLLATQVQAMARRRNAMLMLALVISGVTNLYIGVAGTFVVFYLMRVPHLLSDGLFGTTARLILNDIHDQRRVGGHIGMTTFVTIFGAFCGSAVSGAVGAWLGDGHPWQNIWPFLILGSAGLVGTLLFWMSKVRFPEPEYVSSRNTAVIAVSPAAAAGPSMLPLSPSSTRDTAVIREPLATPRSPE